MVLRKVLAIPTSTKYNTERTSAGYNTINLYAYYGLNSLFKSAQVNGEPNVKA
jgi:hypothetical protein